MTLFESFESERRESTDTVDQSGAGETIFGGATTLPGYGRIPEEARRRTSRFHYRWEIFVLNRDECLAERDLWEANAEANRRYWETGETLEDFWCSGILPADRPCALCASGPSLAYSMTELRSLRDRISVVAVDSALRPLRLVGILPDAVVVHNAGPVTQKLVERFPTERAAFILPVHADPELVASIKGRKFFYVPVDEFPFIHAWAAGFPERLTRLPRKPSTGITAYQAALGAGCANYFLQGYDFSFANDKLWCDAVPYLDMPECIEKLREGDKYGRLYSIPDIFCEPTGTTIRLHLPAEELFRMVRYEERKNVYNSSAGILFNLNWLPVKYSVDFLAGVDAKLKNLHITFGEGQEEEMQRVNENTMNSFAGLLSRNICVNFESGRVTKSIRHWFDDKKRWRNRVAVVAGAGPSLDDCLESLARHREKFMLFAVDASVNPLLEAGLRPDAVITVDPEKRVEQFFEGVDTSGLTLIGYITTHPDVIRLWKGDIEWAWSTLPTEHFIQMTTLFPDLPLMLPFGNCGTTGIMFCIGLGFHDILMTGIDFAYTHDRAYARNVKIEVDYRPENRDDLIASLVKRGKQPIETTDVRGNTVLTDEMLSIYAQNLAGMPGITARLRNAGAGIAHGIPVVDLETFFARRK